jgi:hypothetical protein
MISWFVPSTKEQRFANPDMNPLWKEIANRHPDWEIDDIDYVCNIYVMTGDLAGREAENNTKHLYEEGKLPEYYPKYKKDGKTEDTRGYID